MVTKPEEVIRVRELTKRFSLRRSFVDMLSAHAEPQRRTALDGVNFDAYRGEILGLLGANGAGKTTLVKILSTLLLPSSGHAEVMGYDVVKSARQVRCAVGWCLDTERSFYHRLTGIENLRFFAALNNIGSRRAAARVKQVTEIVGLTDAADDAFRTYSRGMQQKLGLARALLADPPVLLLDEPTKSLDPAAALEFWRFVRGVLAREMKKSVLIVTHNLQEARSCCDRTAFMYQGRISAIGSWQEVESHIRSHGFDEVAAGE